jgi:hypothetical protein
MEQIIKGFRNNIVWVQITILQTPAVPQLCEELAPYGSQHLAVTILLAVLFLAFFMTSSGQLLNQSTDFPVNIWFNMKDYQWFQRCPLCVYHESEQFTYGWPSLLGGSGFVVSSLD